MKVQYQLHRAHLSELLVNQSNLSFSRVLMKLLNLGKISWMSKFNIKTHSLKHLHQRVKQQETLLNLTQSQNTQIFTHISILMEFNHKNHNK